MTTLSPRDALEVMRRALHRFDSNGLHGLAENADTALSVLTALVERAGELVAWMPIETAPRDGTRILLAYPCGAVKFGFYLDNSDTARPWAGWRVTSGELTPNGQPNKWQPLPTAPGASHER